MDFFQTLQEALNKWIEITGVTPDQKSFCVKLNAPGLSSIQIHESMEEYRLALEKDPSGITAAMLLRKDYCLQIAQLSFSLEKILSDSADTRTTLENYRILKNLIYADVIESAIAEFKNITKKACLYYGANLTHIEQAINDDTHGLSDLRYKVFMCTEDLKEYQFSTGSFDNEAPKFYKSILKFPSLKMAVKFAACHKESFLASAIIKDYSNEIFSSFIFLVKNGENIYVLTNKIEWEHPLQEELISGRSGGIRYWERNCENYWNIFPFDTLLNTLEKETDEEKKRGSVLLPIKDLPADSIIWLSMMFEFLKLRYWNKKITLPVSYFTQDALLLPEEISNFQNMRELLPEAQSQKDSQISMTISENKKAFATIQNEDIAMSDISYEAMSSSYEYATNHNKWLEQRYEDKVSTDAINPHKLREKKLLAASTKEVPKKEDYREEEVKKNIPNMLLVLKDEEINYEHLYSLRRDIVAPSSDTFGSLAKLEMQRKQIARYNKAILINHYARKEFEERRDEVLAWVKNQANKNLPNLIKYSAIGKLEAPTFRHGEWFSFDIVKGNICNVTNSIRVSNYGYPSIFIPSNREPTCVVSGCRANLWVSFAPKNAEGLALVLGVKIDELPDVLQNWIIKDTHTQYRGNCLLNNCDPMDWCVTNPWNTLSFVFHIAFSKRGYNKARKEAGLEPICDWENK